MGTHPAGLRLLAQPTVGQECGCPGLGLGGGPTLGLQVLGQGRPGAERSRIQTQSRTESDAASAGRAALQAAALERQQS